MTYSEALFFVGKCLTLGHCPEKIGEVRETIRSGTVAWEQIVWVSTGQYVFPALYLQLKRAGLLPELPPDLVEYMEEYTGVNRERNRQIIDQAHAITALLNQYEIHPVFLKGTAHLLDGLYEDIAERMVGDIDFLVGEKDMVRAAEVLKEDGYYCLPNAVFTLSLMECHYPDLIKDGEMATIEVHRRILEPPYDKFFNFSTVSPDKKKLSITEQAYVLSDCHQIILNMMVVQMKDGGYWGGSIYLRHIYDLFLLSQHVDPLKIAIEFGHYFHWFNAYLAVSSKLLSSPPSLAYQSTRQSRLFLKRFYLETSHPKFARAYTLFFNLFVQGYSYISQLIQTVYRRDVRRNLFRKLTNPRWYGQHWSDLKERL